MKSFWKVIGISAIAAVVLYYPARKLYQYMAKKNEADNETGGESHHLKAFAPAFRGKRAHYPAGHDGRSDHDGTL
jgi:hypothetical protein